MDSQNLKQQIIERVESIDNPKLLENIQQFLNNTSNTDLAEILDAVNSKLQHDSLGEQKDYTSYIKEWVKNM